MVRRYLGVSMRLERVKPGIQAELNPIEFGEKPQYLVDEACLPKDLSEALPIDCAANAR